MANIAMKDDMPFAPEANSEVLKRLQEIDPNLGFIYLPIGIGCWAMTEKWGESDPRRSRIRSGEMPPNKDFDVLCLAPDNLTADDAVELLIKKLRQRNHWDLLDKILAHNKAQRKSNLITAKEFQEEMLKANSGIVHRQAGFTLEGNKVTGTPYKPRKGLTKSERDAKREL